jgi:maltose-binding protein MalE
MKHSKLLVLMLVAILALSSISFVFAQDTMDPVNLVMWSQDGDENNAVLAAQFDIWAEATAPGSTLEIVNKENEVLRTDVLAAGLAGSGLPDLVLGPNDSIGVYVDAGLVQPLDDQFDMSLYANAAGGQIAGVSYGVPVNNGNHLMLMYNKQFVETPPQTWEELVALANQIEADNPDVQGFAYNLNETFWFLPFVAGFGGGVYDAEGNMVLDSQPWIDAYQFVQNLKFVDEAVPSECDYNCASDLFKEGSVAMIINGDWEVNNYLNPETAPALGPDNLGLAPWPELPNGERPKPFTGGKFISIPVTVEGANLDGAVSFVNWLSTDPEAVTAYALGTSRLPAISGVEITDPVLAESAEALATGIGMPPDASLRCMWDSVKPQLEAVMSNSMTPEDAATEAQISAEICLEG